jgi:uncharacterized membrane protein YfcA
MGKKLLGWALFFLISFSLPIHAQDSSPIDEYLQGKMDGERDAEGSPFWFLVGFTCGILGVGGAYIMTPQVPPVALIGKSIEYISGYTAGYQEKARNQNALYASAGCAAGYVLYLLVILLSIPSGPC